MRRPENRPRRAGFRADLAEFVRIVEDELGLTLERALAAGLTVEQVVPRHETLEDSIRRHLAAKVDVRELSHLEQLATLGPDDYFGELGPLLRGQRLHHPLRRGHPSREGVVVDDEPSILLAAAFILETAGCHVICGRSGPEAMLSLASSTRVPDAIICDHELNDKHNGSDVIRHLREEFNCDIPALLVTGNTAGGMAEKSARELGISVLYKPLEGAVLRSSLEELLATGAMT